jgi:hypothetical protein
MVGDHGPGRSEQSRNKPAYFGSPKTDQLTNRRRVDRVMFKNRDHRRTPGFRGTPETKVGTHKEVTVREQRDGKWIVARQIAYAHEPGNPK